MPIFLQSIKFIYLYVRTLRAPLSVSYGFSYLVQLSPKGVNWSTKLVSFFCSVQVVNVSSQLNVRMLLPQPQNQSSIYGQVEKLVFVVGLILF